MSVGNEKMMFENTEDDIHDNLDDFVTQ